MKQTTGDNVSSGESNGLACLLCVFEHQWTTIERLFSSTCDRTTAVGHFAGGVVGNKANQFRVEVKNLTFARNIDPTRTWREERERERKSSIPLGTNEI